MNVKLKLAVAGSVITLGVVGTITAFAGTTNTGESTNGLGTHTTWTGHHGRMRGRGQFDHRGIGLKIVAKALGVSEAMLRNDLQSGQSIVDIATSRGISEDSLVATLKANLKTRLDSGVSAGKMTAEEEQQMLTNFATRVKPNLERKGGQPVPGQSGQPTKTAGSEGWSAHGPSTSANG